MLLNLQRDSLTPLYTQIVCEVRRMIVDGTLKIGDRLPANRQLARSLGVNRNTVTSAYAELAADGLISSRVGSGTYISRVPGPTHSTQSTEREHPAPMSWESLLSVPSRDNWLREMTSFDNRRDLISFSLALPPADLFPLDEFRRCVDRVLRRQGRVLLQLGTTSGYPPLQEYIASQLALAGVRVQPDEILITNGCQQSLDLIRQILVEPGEEVALENPTYPGALSVFCGTSKYFSVPVGENGIDLGVLEDVLSQRRPKLIYVVPSFQNPTGATMNAATRRKLIRIAGRYRVPIVEDDIYRELRYDGPDVPPLKAIDEHGLVIYISSFSKVGFPGLRVGWIAAPKIVIDHLNRVKQRSDLHASLLAQAAIHEFAKHGLLARHVKRVKKAYVQRRDAMLESLDRHFPEEASWTRPEGGMSVWVRLPQSLSSRQLLLQAVEEGVSFISGDHFYASSPQQNMMRLSFTMAGTQAIEEGVKRIGNLMKSRLVKLKKQRPNARPEGFRALV